MVNAFHMDEYVGLPADAPQGFGNFLGEHLFSRVPFGNVHRLNSAADAAAECARYSELLDTYPTDIECLDIGENAHLAFNDPGEAKFDDPQIVKVVILDNVCRQQQVNDGCFASIDEVQTHALSLTIPTLCAPRIWCARYLQQPNAMPSPKPCLVRLPKWSPPPPCVSTPMLLCTAIAIAAPIYKY